MVGIDEIILIGVVALMLFGPDKLPQYLKELGRFYAEIKKVQRELEMELNKVTLVSATPSIIKAPSQTVVEIAKKMNVAVEGKSEEQLLAEIDTAVTRSQVKPDEGPKAQ
jgi:sec-independent protein translocase protein TatA